MSPCVAFAEHPCAGSGTQVREHVGGQLLALGTTESIDIDAHTLLTRSVGAALAVKKLFSKKKKRRVVTTTRIDAIWVYPVKGCRGIRVDR